MLFTHFDEKFDKYMEEIISLCYTDRIVGAVEMGWNIYYEYYTDGLTAEEAWRGYEIL